MSFTSEETFNGYSVEVNFRVSKVLSAAHLHFMLEFLNFFLLLIQMRFRLLAKFQSRIHGSCWRIHRSWMREYKVLKVLLGICTFYVQVHVILQYKIQVILQMHMHITGSLGSLCCCYLEWSVGHSNLKCPAKRRQASSLVGCQHCFQEKLIQTLQGEAHAMFYSAVEAPPGTHLDPVSSISLWQTWIKQCFFLGFVEKLRQWLIRRKKTRWCYYEW